MKTLILALAVVLTLGLGCAFAAMTDTARQNQQQQVARRTQASGAQTGSFYGPSFTAPANEGYIGGSKRLPPNPTGRGE